VNSSTSEIGVELVQFKDQVNPKDNFEYWKTGVFPFCVQDPNVEELAEWIVAAGSKRRMKKPRYNYLGKKPYRIIYMEDPFGNIVEFTAIVTNSFIAKAYTRNLFNNRKLI
jgi:hypothetical protein